MSMTFKLGLSAAAVIAVVVAGGLMLNNRAGPDVGASPSPSPSATRSPTPPSPTPSPPSTTRHTSELYGYTIELPAVFVASAARTSWPSNLPYTPVSAWADRYDGGEELLAIASQPLAEGQSATAWIEAYINRNDERTGDACGDDSLASWDEVEIGAGSGRRFAGTCADEGGSGFVVESVVVNGRDAWVFNWQTETGSDEASLAQLEEILGNFTYPE